MAFSSQYTRKPITDVFTNDTDINRRHCRRVVPMKVLILGLGRTGTACKWLTNHNILCSPANAIAAQKLTESQQCAKQ